MHTRHTGVADAGAAAVCARVADNNRTRHNNIRDQSVGSSAILCSSYMGGMRRDVRCNTRVQKRVAIL